MKHQVIPILARSAPSSGSSASAEERTYNAATLAAMKEASEIMSGKKKVKWNRFQPEITKAEAKEELKKTLES